MSEEVEKSEEGTGGEMEQIYDPYKDSIEDVMAEYPALQTMEHGHGEGNRFTAIAWSGSVTSAWYSEEDSILIHETEGDLHIWKNPTTEKLQEVLQTYSCMEVTGYGERLDNRFNRSKEGA